MTYDCHIQPDALVALDIHVHVERDDDDHLSLPQDIIQAAATYFRAPVTRPTVDETAAVYRERHMAAVVFTVDATTALGHAPNRTEDLVAGAERNADVLIPFGSVDPWSPTVLDRIGELADLGVRGWKFHPSLQGFDPADERHRPMFGALAELGLPLVVHTGQTGIGAGLPGGRGIKLRYSNPMLLDDVAAEFPDLPIVLAHPSVPWQDEALSMATHKANIWIDLSGWSPKYFPAPPGAGSIRTPHPQDALRHGLPAAPARSVAARLRHARPLGRGPQHDPQGQRCPSPRALSSRVEWGSCD